MRIDEQELRSVVRKLLLEFRFSSIRAADRYTGPYGFIQKIRDYLSGETTSAGSAGNVPTDFQVEKTYTDITDRMTTNRAKADTIMIMRPFGQEIDHTSPDAGQVGRLYDASIATVEERISNLNRLAPTGTLEDLLPQLNVILMPLGLSFDAVDIKGLVSYYKDKHKNPTKRSEGVRKFLERAKKDVRKYLPQRLKEVKADVDYAKDSGFITEEQVKRFDRVLSMI